MLHTRTVYIQGINFLKAIELLSAEARTRTLIMVHQRGCSRLSSTFGVSQGSDR